MLSFSTHNRRGVGWLLTIAFLLMTLPTHFGWQCLDGTPCPMKCPMGRNVSSPSPAQVKLPDAGCMRCRSAAAAIVAASPAGPGISKTPCVLKADTQPVLTLVERTHFTLPMLALPPPQTETVVANVSAPLIQAETLLTLPPRFLRPPSGRAPPVHLS